MQKKKSGTMKSGLDAMPLFLLDDPLNATKNIVLHNAHCFTFLIGTFFTAFDSFCEFQK
jgi:hypothetical protein